MEVTVFLVIFLFSVAVIGILPYAVTLIVLMFILLLFPELVFVPMEFFTAK